MTESLLYKQIVRFFSAEGGSASGGEEEKIADKFEVAFITITHGVINADHHADRKTQICARISVEDRRVDQRNLPPANFRSGALWVKKAQIEQMADSIAEYVSNVKGQMSVVAYCRGAYLEAVRLANTRIKRGSESSLRSSAADQNADPRGDQRSGSAYRSAIIEIFTDDELAQLKKKGIMWMKVGLRMPEAFGIFQKRIRELLRENETRQLNLF